MTMLLKTGMSPWSPHNVHIAVSVLFWTLLTLHIADGKGPFVFGVHKVFHEG